MSVFQPVDVRAPNDRRKQLVAKLMQQQAAQAPGRQALAAVSARPLGAARAGGRGTAIQHNNVIAAIMSRLGVGQRGEVDPGFGPHISGADPYSTGHYVAPNEVAPGGGPGIGTPSQVTSGAPGAGASSINVMGPDGQPIQVNTGPPDLPPGTFATDTGVYSGGAVVGMSGVNAGVIPLGGGMYYDPVTDAVHGAPSR